MAADPSDKTSVKSHGSIVPFVAACLIVSLAGLVAGALLPWFDRAGVAGQTQVEASCGSDASATAGLAGTVSSIVELPSVVTNLAGDGAPWVRLDASIVLPDAFADKSRVAAELAQDFMGYARTLKAGQLVGGSGLYLLKQDLKDIARMRTSGASMDVLIRTLIVE
ncbi:MAG: flagellar basal body-associated FliL family protein [Hyphomicrobium sp.]|nr:flagellar basal body-associated FliL family protein [Hyphomicrobium sp.]